MHVSILSGVYSLYSSVQILFSQRSFRISSFYFGKNAFIIPASILATFFSSTQLLTVVSTFSSEISDIVDCLEDT